MKPHIKIAVIGGTGKAGKHLITQLIKEGHHFKALVRNPEKFTTESPFVETITGNASNYNDINKLLDGCTAVISTLGMGIPPSKPTIFNASTGNILRAMKAYGIKRYIVITGLNVDTPFDKKGPKAKMATEWMYDTYPVSTQNKQEEYDLLSKSEIEWTMVRLPMIELTDNNPEIDINTEDCPGDAISATSLAQFLISQIEDRDYIRQAPFIANV
jgi:putative NADH-flavin reductase